MTDLIDAWAEREVERRSRGEEKHELEVARAFRYGLLIGMLPTIAFIILWVVKP